MLVSNKRNGVSIYVYQTDDVNTLLSIFFSSLFIDDDISKSHNELNSNVVCFLTRSLMVILIPRL